MSVFPVIMCGGGGSRLWPTSQPASPKQFIKLRDDRSLFQETAIRVMALDDVAELVVVANAAHASLIALQLAEVGLRGAMLLEPVPRDSAPAVAAAAAWVAARDPGGVLVVVASDHHLPDHEAFSASTKAAVAAALQGRIVTFGVAPATASTAYGYITPAPGPELVKPIKSFVEKPDAATARRLVADGYLWNSGNFVASATTLLESFMEHAPDVLSAVSAAVAEARVEQDRFFLSGRFETSPSISLDYAVMERTTLASVVAVSFEWSDLGAWSAIRDIMDRDDSGNAVAGAAFVLDTTGCLIRSDGRPVAVIGARNLVVVVENGAVLVCDLAADQKVKTAVEHFRRVEEASAPAHPEAAPDLDSWLRNAALPLWWSLGADHDGWGYHEELGSRGGPTGAPRRLRVQARQAWAFCRAGALGWPGPWRAAVDRGLDAIDRWYLMPNGLYRGLADGAPASVGDSHRLYDQAFVLLLLAAAAKADWRKAEMVERAERLRSAVRATYGAESRGFREEGAHPWQSNCQMHLLEASLGWIAIDPDRAAPWRELAAELATLAQERLIDETGVIGEVFDEAWRPAAGADGDFFEPGHQFEWAWLLNGWKQSGGAIDHSVIRGLYEAGRRGYDGKRGVVVNTMSRGGAVLDANARLWPQTEAFRAAEMMYDIEGKPEFSAHAAAVAKAIHRYLDTRIPGLWRDVLTPGDTFVEQPAPASSLYHLMVMMKAPGALERPGRS